MAQDQQSKAAASTAAAASSSSAAAPALRPPPLPGAGAGGTDKIGRLEDLAALAPTQPGKDAASPPPLPPQRNAVATPPPVKAAALPPPASSPLAAPPAPRPAARPAPRQEPPASQSTSGHAQAATEAGLSTADDDAQVRVARRRPAGPVRHRLAANDDAPSIGGLIFALEQKPSTRPYFYAWIATAVWTVIGLAFAGFLLTNELQQGSSLIDVLTRPAAYTLFAGMVIPVAVIWFLALLSWRAEELRLRSSTMTEVAIRLAEPDRMAEQQIASLGQAVRRQVSFMNDAVSRALGRAGELEALVHSEVAALERSYEENERRIRGLIQELGGERQALISTSDTVSTTLRDLGSEIPDLIEKLTFQQAKLAQIIAGAGDNLTSLETAITQTSLQLETSVGRSAERLETAMTTGSARIGGTIEGGVGRMENVLESSNARLESSLQTNNARLESVLESYTTALGSALGNNVGQMENVLETYTAALGTALTTRTDNLQTVFEEYTRALDTTLANRSASLDNQLVERTKALDSAFSERLRLFDESIMRSTLAIDSAISDKQLALTSALEAHAKSFSDTVSRQSMQLDESLVQGINAVRRSSENITRQSLKAIEGLASQSDLLKNVSENLLGQITSVTGRFENQGQQIIRAANALESANYKIDQTLQARHTDLTDTLGRLSGKAEEFSRFMQGYSTALEGSVAEAELRARAAAEEMQRAAEQRQRLAMTDLDRLRSEADAQTERALEDLRRRVSHVSTEVTQQLGSLSTRFDETSEEVRQRAARAANELAEEQARLRSEFERLPTATRESADAMRRALGDQLKALEQLSSFTTRAAAERDVMPPLASFTPPKSATEPPTTSPSSAARAPLSGSLTSTLASELNAIQQQRFGQPASSPPPSSAPALPPPSAMSPQGSDNWSLGDLLKRASKDEAGAEMARSGHHPSALHAGPAAQSPTPPTGGMSGMPPMPAPLPPSHAVAPMGNMPPPPAAGHIATAGHMSTAGHMPTAGHMASQPYPAPLAPRTPFALDIHVIARALDPATAAAICTRFRSGQRGIMVRSIYTPEGRATFDEVSNRYRSDPDLRQTIDRYLADFERLLKEAEARDPSGQTIQNHFVSDTGRVYLFLAHASGRLT